MNYPNNNHPNIILNPQTKAYRIGLALTPNDVGYFCWDITDDLPYWWDGSDWFTPGGGSGIASVTSPDGSINVVNPSGANVQLSVPVPATEIVFGSATNTPSHSADFTYAPLTQVFSVGFGSNPYLLVDAGNKQYSFGDINGVGNGGVIVLDDVGPTLAFYLKVATSAGSQVFAIGGNNYSFGDLTSANNGLQFNLNDSNGNVTIDNTAHNAVIVINGNVGATGTFAVPTSITVVGGIVTAVS